jgi:hypothetical protein
VVVAWSLGFHRAVTERALGVGPTGHAPRQGACGWRTSRGAWGGVHNVSAEGEAVVAPGALIRFLIK